LSGFVVELDEKGFIMSVRNIDKGKVTWEINSQSRNVFPMGLDYSNWEMISHPKLLNLWEIDLSQTNIIFECHLNLYALQHQSWRFLRELIDCVYPCKKDLFDFRKVDQISQVPT